MGHGIQHDGRNWLSIVVGIVLLLLCVCVCVCVFLVFWGVDRKP